MRTLQQRITRFALPISLLVIAVVFSPSVVSAQNQGGGSIAWGIAKSVVLDPTTYTPAMLSYTSQRMDWNTSEVLFKAGWLEHNSRFTVSGRPDDTPIGYEAGTRQIRRYALAHLQESVVNNVSALIFERTLTQKYPEQRKLFKMLSWVERISSSAYVGYLASVDHFRQAQRNQDTAKDLGSQ